MPKYSDLEIPYASPEAQEDAEYEAKRQRHNRAVKGILSEIGPWKRELLPEGMVEAHEPEVTLHLQKKAAPMVNTRTGELWIDPFQGPNSSAHELGHLRNGNDERAANDAANMILFSEDMPMDPEGLVESVATHEDRDPKEGEGAGTISPRNAFEQWLLRKFGYETDSRKGSFKKPKDSK